MKKVKLKQIKALVGKVIDSGINRKNFQDLLDSSYFEDLLLEFKDEQDRSETTIAPIEMKVSYNHTLVEMLDASGYISNTPDLNDQHFPIEARDDEREFVLVCFNREIKDNEELAKSKLLRKLHKLGLEPEGLAELCALGKRHPDLQQRFPIVARGQVWRDADGIFVCPILLLHDGEAGVSLCGVHEAWFRSCWFLCSRKVEKQIHPKPTITPLEFAGKYSDFRRQHQTLVQALGAMGLDGYKDVNDQHFPLEGREEDREFVLVCFNRDIDDNEDPAKSELLQELDKLGLEPEGPMELCFVGADERTRDLHSIVARRQVCRDPDDYLFCPSLFEDEDGRGLGPVRVQEGWFGSERFLASRK